MEAFSSMKEERQLPFYGIFLIIIEKYGFTTYFFNAEKQ